MNFPIFATNSLSILCLTRMSRTFLIIIPVAVGWWDRMGGWGCDRLDHGQCLPSSLSSFFFLLIFFFSLKMWFSSQKLLMMIRSSLLWSGCWFCPRPDGVYPGRFGQNVSDMGGRWRSHRLLYRFLWFAMNQFRDFHYYMRGICESPIPCSRMFYCVAVLDRPSKHVAMSDVCWRLIAL